MPLSVALVGAGVAGLSCARILCDAGAHVTLFEQGAQAGGRLMTRRTEVGGFDVGVQYFTRETVPFTTAVERWIDRGVCAAWPARIARLPRQRGSGVQRVASGAALVGVPSMAALADHLSVGLDVRCEQRVKRIEPLGRTRPRRWTVKRAADATDPDGIEVTEGIFDVVLTATPAAAAAALLDPAPELVHALRRVTMDPCFALLLAFGEPLPLPYDGAVIDQHRLAWVARDSAKPGRRPGERWVAYASGAWSREHYDDDPEDVRAKLVKAFSEATATSLQPLYCSIYRWSAAFAGRTLAQPCLYSDAEHLGACGDWCAGTQFESAWMSGRALALEVLRSLGGTA